MSKVYVPQIPSRYDGGTNLWIPTINIKPAEQFGEVVVMLPPAAARSGIDACAAVIAERMSEFGAEDYLVAVGDPTLYAIAAVHAARRADGVLRMLKWDRLKSGYVLEEVEVETVA
jgi:hypothetical protein